MCSTKLLYLLLISAVSLTGCSSKLEKHSANPELMYKQKTVHEESVERIKSINKIYAKNEMKSNLDPSIIDKNRIIGKLRDNN